MKFEIREVDNVQIVVLKGEMVGGPDATLLSEKIREWIEEDKKNIIIDMKHVHWMNSSGLGILIGGLSALRNQGGDLRLLHVDDKPKKLLEVTKLDCVFQIFNEEEKALESFK